MVKLQSGPDDSNSRSFPPCYSRCSDATACCWRLTSDPNSLATSHQLPPTMAGHGGCTILPGEVHVSAQLPSSLKPYASSKSMALFVKSTSLKMREYKFSQAQLRAHLLARPVGGCMTIRLFSSAPSTKENKKILARAAEHRLAVTPTELVYCDGLKVWHHVHGHDAPGTAMATRMDYFWRALPRSSLYAQPDQHVVL